MQLVLLGQFCGRQTPLLSAAGGGDAPAAAESPALSPSGQGEGNLECFLSCNPLKSPVQKRMPVMCGVGLLDAHTVCPLSFLPLFCDSSAKFLPGLFPEHSVLRHALVL